MARCHQFWMYSCLKTGVKYSPKFLMLHNSSQLMLLIKTGFSPVVCQGVLIANRSRGKIESLNFPNDYPSHADCSWTIQASMGNTINYTFITFEMESNVGCAYDYVKVSTCFVKPHLKIYPILLLKVNIKLKRTISAFLIDFLVIFCMSLKYLSFNGWDHKGHTRC